MDALQRTIIQLFCRPTGNWTVIVPDLDSQQNLVRAMDLARNWQRTDPKFVQPAVEQVVGHGLQRIEDALMEANRIVERIATALDRISLAHERVANHVDPAPPDIVDTTYVANSLGCTTTWVLKVPFCVE